MAYQGVGRFVVGLGDILCGPVRGFARTSGLSLWLSPEGCIQRGDLDNMYRRLEVDFCGLQKLKF